MNIGFFTESYLPSHDGVATSVAMTAKQLTKLGHTVTIVAPNRPHVREKKNVYRIISVKLLDNPEIWEAIEVPQSSLFELFQKDFDIIHIHSAGIITNIGWQIAKLHHIPLVMTYHTLWKYYIHYFPLPFLINPWFLKELNSLVGNACDALIAPSEKVKRILKSYGIRKPIYVIPNGIEIDRFSHPYKGYLRQKLNIPNSYTLLLSVGRLEKEKSPDFIISAFSHIAKNNPNIALVFVGEGREKIHLQNYAKELQLESQIFFGGVISYTHMPQIYADADIFLFASKSETQGMVIYEALASGLAIVAIHDTAFSSILKDGYNSYLVDKDPKEFAKKIQHLINNKIIREDFRKNAQKSVIPFSTENTVKQLEQCYYSIRPGSI